MEVLKQGYLEKMFGSVDEGIKYAESLKLEYPKRPIKPVLNHQHTKEQLSAYSTAFFGYEKEMEYYQSQMIHYKERENLIDLRIKEYIKYAAHLEGVPEQYRKKVWNKAWEDGHSNGYTEVYQCLYQLVDIFL